MHALSEDAAQTEVLGLVHSYFLGTLDPAWGFFPCLIRCNAFFLNLLLEQQCSISYLIFCHPVRPLSIKAVRLRVQRNPIIISGNAHQSRCITCMTVICSDSRILSCFPVQIKIRIDIHTSHNTTPQDAGVVGIRPL
jgi:hypothetical protein